MTTYVKRLNRHLTAYKTSRLGISEKGAFNYRKRIVFHGHILPGHQSKWLNILEPIRSDVQKFVSSSPDIQLHQYFHHLNSSQAFALNLFFPFFERRASSNLIAALGLKGRAQWWKPEHVVNVGDGTNVDIAWRDENERWTYCEVKLSEGSFGRADVRKEGYHERKLSCIYAPVLKAHCAPEQLETDYFFANYQILRNVWLAARDESSSLIFLLPREHSSLWETVVAARQLLKPGLAARVHIVAIEDVLHHLLEDKSLDPQLSIYAELLADKYLPV